MAKYHNIDIQSDVHSRNTLNFFVKYAHIHSANYGHSAVYETNSIMYSSRAKKYSYISTVDYQINRLT